MKRSKLLQMVLSVVVCLTGPPATVQAVITKTGDVRPDPTATLWDSSTTGYVGYESGGTLTVNGTSGLLSGACYIGKGVSGTATVDGRGSTWANSDSLSVGSDYGNGTLNITNGGLVTSDSAQVGRGAWSYGFASIDGSGSTWVVSGGLGLSEIVQVFHEDYSVSLGYSFGNLSITHGGSVRSDASRIGWSCGDSYVASGGVTVDGTGSIWNSGDLRMEAGNLTITNGGYVSGSSSELGSGIGIVLSSVTVTGTDSTWNSGPLSFGGYNIGTVHVSNGGALVSDGCQADEQSVASLTIGGSGSTWANHGDFVLRGNGRGNSSMTILDGGKVYNYACCLGGDGYQAVTATVDGFGSTWTNNGCLSLCAMESDWGPSTVLNITSGGVVTTTQLVIEEGSALTVGSQSLLAVNVGSDFLSDTGDGTIANDGTVRISAGANVAAGGYAAIAAGTWTGSGIYQALGGIWNSDSREFMVSTARNESSGVEITDINLVATQRVLVSADNGWSVGASFLSSSSTMDFKATAVSSILTDLETKAVGQSIRSAWEFSTDDYAVSSTNPIFLSFNVGSGYSWDDFHVWHYTANGVWEAYAASDLTYDGTYASFTVTSLSGYAVTAVPEPGTLVLLVTGLLGLLIVTRQRGRLKGRLKGSGKTKVSGVFTLVW